MTIQTEQKNEPITTPSKKYASLRLCDDPDTYRRGFEDGINVGFENARKVFEEKEGEMEYEKREEKP